MTWSVINGRSVEPEPDEDAEAAWLLYLGRDDGDGAEADVRIAFVDGTMCSHEAAVEAMAEHLNSDHLPRRITVDRAGNSSVKDE